MPDDRYDDARHALEEVTPTTDLWAAAQHRVSSAVAPLTSVAPRRSRWRWAIAAAVVTVPAVAVALVWPDPSREVPVETGPSSSGVPVVTVPGDRSTCGYGLAGEPIVLLPGPADPPLIDVGGQPAQQIVSHLDLGDLTAEIHVPGVVVIDLVGERVETVDLQRGPAMAWLTDEFVQIRWFTGSQEACESFTVTVAGGLAHENLAAAAEIADRMLLESDLARPSGDEGGSSTSVGDFSAIWPETDPSELSAEEPAWSTSQNETALTFARDLLGWDDAVFDPGASEPLEDGTGGSLIGVTSPSRGRALSVIVRPIANGRYRVSGVRPLQEFSASVSVQGREAWVSVSWDPPLPERVTCSARFSYAGRHVLAAMEDTVDLGFTPDTQGAVVVLCRDMSDEVVTAWGTGLPAGDFAAG